MRSFNSHFLADLARIAGNGGFRMEETKEQKEEREKKEKAEKEKPPIVPKVDAANAADLVDRIVQRYGTERAALAVLADENFAYRDRHREEQEWRTNIMPRTLTAEQHADWVKYVALGKPDDLKTQVEKVPALELQAKEHNERALFLEVGQAAGMKPNVLQDLAKTKGFTVELRTEKVDGEDVKVAYAKGSGKDDQFIKLADYAEKHLKDYVPSLTAEDSSDRDTRTPVVPFVKQPQPVGKKDKAPKGEIEVVNQYLASAYKTPGQMAEAKK